MEDSESYVTAKQLLYTILLNKDTEKCILHHPQIITKLSNAKIYVVIGETGEYSDSLKWLVKSFVKKDDAKSFCETKLENDELEFWDLQGRNKYDPKFERSYPGTEYYYEEIELS